MSTFESSNPYQSPPEAGTYESIGVSSSVLESLRQTRPYVLFLGILGFIGTALILLAAIFMVGAGAAGGGVGGGPFPGAGGVVIGIVYLLMGLLYIPPSLYLVRYAGRIKTLLAAPSTSALEEALTAQKSFWKFVCIFMIVIMAFYLVAIVIGIGAAFFAAV